MSVVYDDWKGEEWLPNGGRRCRHEPTGCVFDCWIDTHSEERVVLLKGAATTELFELAKGYYRVFGHQNRHPEERGLFDAIRELAAKKLP